MFRAITHDVRPRGSGSEFFEVKWSAAIVASWARYAEGVDEQGVLEVVDHRKDTLMANVRCQREDSLAFIADREVFGDLIDDERFTSL